MVDRAPLLGNHEEEPTTPVDLKWSNLNCTVKVKEGDRTILKDASGHAFHSEFLVIMGSSGAGKTTLLNILSDKLRQSKTLKISGQVEANSQLISSIIFSNYIGYVTQEDYLIESMTVFECLMFVAKLKTAYPDKSAKVHSLLSELNLDSCKHSMIGGPFISGISGGEKKRTCIGMELITNPSILFLDEPTSGLDSYTSLLVCKLLVHQASLGKTIISTIHQPSSDIFYLFDKLMLLAEGRVVYYGTAKESVKVVAGAGFVCPTFSNPADYFMEILYIENSTKLSVKEIETLDKLETMTRSRNIVKSGLELKLESKSIRYKTGFCYQLLVLSHRTLVRAMRNPILSFIRFVMVMFSATIVALFYWDMGTSGLRAFTNRNGLFFFSLVCIVLSNTLSRILTFPSMRPIMLKEHHSNLYGILPYFLSVNLTDLLFDILYAISFSSVVYWSTGLNTNTYEAVIGYFLITLVAFLCGGSFGMLGGSVFGRPELALMGCSTVMFPFLYFTGFYRSGNLPNAFKWVQVVNPFHYLFQAYMKNEYNDLELTNCYLCKEITSCIPCNPLGSYNVTSEVYESLSVALCLTVFYRLAALLAMQITVKRSKS